MKREKKENNQSNSLMIFEPKRNIFKKLYYKFKMRKSKVPANEIQLAVVKPKNIFKKVVLSLLAILIVIIASTVIFVFSKFSKIEKITLRDAELDISQAVDSKYRNIALFAVDSRDMNSDLGARSDGIIVLSINEETNEVKMCSVYRDTYVLVEGHDLTKITHAYAYGGPSLAIKTLNKNLDLNISEFVSVDFEAVADVVDLIGGVEIDIKQDEIEQLNSAMKETAKVTGKSAEQIRTAGVHNLNGVQAVSYGRVRYTEGNDYRRTERMRTVIEKAFAKAKTMDLATLNKVLDAILPKVQTNIKNKDMIEIVTNIPKLKITDSKGWPYETRGVTLDAWYGIPVTLESNVKTLHQELFEQNNYEPSQMVKDISNKIIKKVGQ